MTVVVDPSAGLSTAAPALLAWSAFPCVATFPYPLSRCACTLTVPRAVSPGFFLVIQPSRFFLFFSTFAGSLLPRLGPFPRFCWSPPPAGPFSFWPVLYAFAVFSTRPMSSSAPLHMPRFCSRCVPFVAARNGLAYANRSAFLSFRLWFRVSRVVHELFPRLHTIRRRLILTLLIAGL